MREFPYGAKPLGGALCGLHRVRGTGMALPNPHFEASYARIFGQDVGMDERADEFFTAFYHRFLNEPGIADMFAGTNIVRQVQMLKKSVFQLVSFYVVNAPTSEMERLAILHQRLGLSGDLFDAWMRALLDTVRDYDPQYDELTEIAWCWALAPGIAYMRLAPVLSDAADGNSK